MPSCPASLCGLNIEPQRKALFKETQFISTKIIRVVCEMYNLIWLNFAAFTILFLWIFSLVALFHELILRYCQFPVVSAPFVLASLQSQAIVKF